ncbi:MAG: HD domain-containing protein [Nanoarchaeota archaeon]|nr:HD domain-containing protein [Nanoarchaeota archaeon]
MEAFDSKRSVGRRDEEDYKVVLANPFEEDETRIYRCPSYRRLGSKTQVMTSPEDYYIRTRLVHTQEVMALAVHISQALGLNTSLCRAIAAGHDIGHAPYGHLGESVLTEIMGKPFSHNIASVVVAQQLENKGKGLNLSFETLEGILFHSKTKSRKVEAHKNVPHEYNAVMFSDKIAYTTSDINDSIRYGYLNADKLPDFVNRLGKTQDERDFNVLKALIKESKRIGIVQLTEGQVAGDFYKTRNFMFEEVYYKIENPVNRAILKKVYDFFVTEPYFRDNEIDPLIAIVLLTDEECNRMGKMMMGSRRFTLDNLRDFSIFSYLSVFSRRKIDITDPDLDWGYERRRARNVL